MTRASSTTCALHRTTQHVHHKARSKRGTAVHKTWSAHSVGHARCATYRLLVCEAVAPGTRWLNSRHFNSCITRSARVLACVARRSNTSRGGAGGGENDASEQETRCPLPCTGKQASAAHGELQAQPIREAQIHGAQRGGSVRVSQPCGNDVELQRGCARVGQPTVPPSPLILIGR